MNESKYVAEQRKQIPNRLLVETFGDEAPVEPLEFQEMPSIVERLKIQDAWIDPKVQTMAHGVEEFIKEQVKSEKLREGIIGYNTVLDRMISRMPEPLQLLIQSKQGVKVLEFLFRESAINNKLSSKTFLWKVEEDVKYRRVEFLLNKLKTALGNL